MLWLFQQNQCNHSLSAQKGSLQLEPLKLSVSQDFKKCFKETNLRCWNSRLQVRGRRTFSECLDATGMTTPRLEHPSSSWRASRSSDKLLWEWLSWWLSLALYSVNCGEAMNHPQSFTAGTHLLYLAQSFQQNFSWKGIVQENEIIIHFPWVQFH